MGEKVERLVALSRSEEFPQLDADDWSLIALAGKLDWSPKKNWVEKAGGLPKDLESMAIHMMQESGLTREHAIPASIERMKVLAAKGDPRWVKVLAQWEKMKASTHSKDATK